MDKELNKLFEVMSKLNPEFKLNEATPTFDSSFSGQNTQHTATNNIYQQDIKTSDAKAYNKAQQQAKVLSKKTSKINTTIEFPDAFRIWFQELGYSPEKGNITIAKVQSEIRKVMTQLGYK